MMYKDFLTDRFCGCLVGLAAGDALGTPFEMMTREEILKATDGKGVAGFLPSGRTKIADTRDLPAGSTTDDTQLSFVVARSLIRSTGFNLTDQARELVAEYEKTIFGWGRTTKTGAEALARWFDSAGKEEKFPLFQAPPPQKDREGCGNGVAMKIAPLALLRATNFDFKEGLFVAEAMDLGLLTHGDPRASYAAIAVGYAIAFMPHVLPFPCWSVVRSAFQKELIKKISGIENVYQNFRFNPDTLSARLGRAFNLLDSPDELREQVGTGCFALESAPFAIAVFLRHPDDFRAGVLEAANAGGDTDTTASMVGAMIGANVGLSGIPPEWVDGLLCRDEAIKLADELAELAMKEKTE